MGKTKYIDAETVIVALRIMEKEHKENAHGDPFEAVYAGAIAGIANAIDKLPAADIVDVVRCKDCKYQDKGENDCEAWNLCGYRPGCICQQKTMPFAVKGSGKMAKYIDIEPLEKDGWMLRRNTFTIDSATVELKHLRDFPTVEISDIITSDNEYMGSVVQGRWIPVTERLPEEEGQCLVCCNSKYQIEVARFYINYDGDRWFCCDWNDPEDIVAWMPLPDPYKEGEQNE